ncbi:MAG TPA: metallophosphoesterase, partial [Terricaulis sp.]|nr:metallophosphoesterase [Terricaulis sp.]
LIVWASLWLVRRWDGLKHRWLIVAALGLFELAYWANIYAWFVEPNRLVIREVEIVSPHWQGAPLTIAAIADTHVGGPHVDAARMGRIVRRVNGLRPDLVVLLGDYVNGHAPEAERSGREQQEILAAFALLDAPLGAVAVIGNHDVWYDRASITQALQEAGIAALWNSNVVIPRAGGDVVILGLEDDMTSHPDFAAARDGAPRGDTLVLSHSPDPFADAPHGDFALMLAGHGHCGQVTIPLIGRPILPLRHRNYACGLIEESGAAMFVSGGVGTSILPVRFLNPPEIVLIRLRGAQR